MEVKVGMKFKVVGWQYFSSGNLQRIAKLGGIWTVTSVNESCSGAHTCFDKDSDRCNNCPTKVSVRMSTPEGNFGFCLCPRRLEYVPEGLPPSGSKMEDIVI
jgi:hypothetical protein